MQVKTADQAMDMIEGNFYENHNFYTNSCAMSPLTSLFLV